MKTSPEKSVKRCAKCAALKPLFEFGNEARKPDGKKSHCHACIKIIRRAQYLRHRKKRIAGTVAWRLRNPEKHLEQMRRYRRGLKAQIIAAYGGKCQCCGETTPEFLTLEHINGGGRAHRNGRNSNAVYREVIASGFPKHFTVLCMNCNFAKGMYGKCPHQK